MATLYCGDALTVLKTLPEESVRCCVSSPPYWGLRAYGTEPQVFGGNPACAHEWTEHLPPAANGLVNNTMQGETLSGRSATRTPKLSAFCSLCGAWRGELGLEPTPDLYIEHMVEVFREVRRVLTEDGTLWLNMGDSYCTTPRGNRPGDFSTSSLTNPGRQDAIPRGRLDFAKPSKQRTNTGSNFAGPHRLNRLDGLKGKDLMGMPWRLAFALQADGWWLRSDIVWSKPNPMPESVTDRPTKSHEYLFLLAKSERYYYDAAAIAELATDTTIERLAQPTFHDQQGGPKDPGNGNRSMRKALVNLRKRSDRIGGANHEARGQHSEGGLFTGQLTRNARTVWEIATQPYPEAHFATFPEELARRCIVAGSRHGDTVLDPFGGSGTVAQVATGNGRDSIYIDLNPKYIELARQRIGPMLCDEGVSA